MATNGKKNKSIFILLAVLLVSGVAGTYFYLKGQGHEKTDNAQLDGTIMAVRTSVSGYVNAVNFEENKPVQKGDVLIVLDSSDYLAKVNLAKASLENAQAQLATARIGATAATQNANASALGSEALKQNISTAETRLWKARQELSRVEKMVKTDAATPQQFDATKAEVQTAEAALAMAKKQYESGVTQSGGVRTQASAQKSQIGLAEALVKQREAELQLAQTQLNNTKVLAPFDGIVSKKAVDVGQFLQIGQPVSSVVSQHSLWVTANFKETQFNELRLGQSVAVKVDAYPDLTLQGTLESFGGATGARFALLPPDNATGNFVKVTQRIPVRIKLQEPKEDLYLSPGMSVSVDVNTKK